MNFGKAFAILLIVLQIGASVGYAVQHDWRRAAYWVLSASIMAVVTL